MTWKKGQSGNPKGRPREGATLTDLLKEKLDKEVFIERLIKLADEGNTKAIEMIYDRIDGKLKDQIEHEINNFEIHVVDIEKKK